MNRLSLGIDIGGTYIKYLIADHKYNIIDTKSITTPEVIKYEDFYDYLCDNIFSEYIIDTIGISAPGLIDEESNVRSYASEKVKVMYNTNINNEIYQRIKIRSASMNDAKAAGLCELKLGNAKDSASSAFIVIGTGIGGCICNNEDVIYGADRFSGEFHFFSSFDPTANKIIRQGDSASVTGLINIYRNLLSADNKKVTNVREILNKYLESEARAVRAVEEWIMNISVLLLNVSVLYNPQVICIGGGLSGEKWLIENIETKYHKLCRDMQLGFLTTKIRDCKFKNNANALGAILNAEREIYGKTR